MHERLRLQFNHMYIIMHYYDKCIRFILTLLCILFSMEEVLLLGLRSRSCSVIGNNIIMIDKETDITKHNSAQ